MCEKLTQVLFFFRIFCQNVFQKSEKCQNFDIRVSSSSVLLRHISAEVKSNFV